jgi:hypothetical protein
MDYIEITFTAVADHERTLLPPFLGATLRGALGHLLKQATCQVSHGECSRCLLRPVCVYPAVFEGLPPADREWMRKYPSIPQPFVLVIDPLFSRAEDARTLRWGIRLFGPATRYWPYIIHVFQMAGQRGIGQSKVQFEIISIDDSISGKQLFSHRSDEVSSPSIQSISLGDLSLSGPCSLRWVFHTPTRITNKRGRLDGLSLVLAGLRRYNVMEHFYGGRGSWQSEKRFEVDDFVTEVGNLRPYKFSRFSGRQQRKMDLQGLVGEATIYGPWHELTDLLSALPRLHLGKSTSFGFGRVTWEKAP